MNPDMLEGMAKEKTTEIMTEEEFLDAIMNEPSLFQGVHNTTQELADKIAVLEPVDKKLPKGAYTLAIPPKFLRPEWCETMLRDRDFLGGWNRKEFAGGILKETWEQIPLDLRLEVTKDEPRLAKRIPGLPYELWKDLVSANHGLRRSSIQHVNDIPEEHRTEELILLALKESPKFISEVPESMLTQEFLYKASDVNPQVLSSIPDNFITKELTEKCLRKGARLKKALPISYWDSDMVAAALNNPRNINWIPPELMEIKRLPWGTMWDLYVHNGGSVKSVPEHHRSQKMILDYIRNIHKESSLVKDADYEPSRIAPITIESETQIKAVKEMGEKALNILISDTFGGVDSISSETWDKIIGMFPRAIRYMPEEMQTPEMIERALSACNGEKDFNRLISKINTKRIDKRHVPFLMGTDIPWVQ